MEDYLQEQSKRAHKWFLNHAFPIWFERAIDWDRGGFFDSLDLASARNAADRKRLRVAARQIFAFSCALDIGFDDGRRAIHHGLDFIFQRARHPEGGFTSDFDLSSSQINKRRDSYDLAFVIFALAHSYRHLMDTKLLDEALALAHLFEHSLRHPSGGFLEGLPAQLPRRQNPHMHLFEACIAWIPYDRTGTFRRLCVEASELLLDRFLVSENGAILEYYNDDWSQPPGELNGCVEPGHLYEWYWLLSSFEEATGTHVAAKERIYEYADRFGYNWETGLLFGEISTDGRARKASVRLWPHTERVRAELQYMKRHPEAPLSKLKTALDAIWRFLDCPIPGLWFERFDAENLRFVVEPAPATSLYHITGAFYALIKLSNQLRASCFQDGGAETSRLTERAE